MTAPSTCSKRDNPPMRDNSPRANLDGKRSPPVPVRYLVLAWLCAAATIAYSQRFPLGVLVTLVQDDLKIDDEAMGWAISAFFISYALFQIPGGWLSDRWGSRAALALFVTACSLAVGLTGAATGIVALVVFRLTAGAGQAGIFPAATLSMARWFPSTERAVSSGLLAGCMSLGGVVATALAGSLLLLCSWRWVFLIFAIPGIAWSVGFYLWFRNRPEEHSGVRAAELSVIRGGAAESDHDRHSTSEPTPWIALARSASMWLIAWQQFFRAAGYALFTSWFPKYLQKVYEITVEEAGVLTSIALAAVVVGSPLGGILSDWLLVRSGSRRISRQGTAIVTMLACAAFFALSMLPTRPGPAVMLIAAAAFFGAVAGPIAYAITIDMGGRHVATVFSVMNMAGNIGAAAFPVVVGSLVERTGRWEWIPLLVAGIYVAGAVCWLFLNPNGTVFRSNTER